MELTAVTNFGQSKIERYNWTVQDAPGEQRLLHKDVLNIHPAYQRDLVESKVTEISAAWSWVALGALVVGERGGEFWVIDGQHRAAAAKRRLDITHLPCVVFQTSDVQQEARGFLTIQMNRKAVTAVAKQKAMVTAGDEVAVLVQKHLQALGLKIKQNATNAGEIKCVAWCHKRASDDVESFKKILGFGAELCVKDDMAVSERVLEGLWVLNERCAGFNSAKFVKRLRDIGGKGLLKAATQASAYYAMGGGKVWALGMLDVVNKGLQQKSRFVFDEVS